MIMKATGIFRRTALALLPATLLIAACSKSDTPAPAPVDQGRINFYHAAANANVALKFQADEADKATITYGQNSGYQGVNTGSRTLKTTVAASSSTTVASTPATLEKDKSYSYFVYANAQATQAGLLVADDLTAPSATKAKIRFVNLGQGTASPLKLSTTVATVSDIANTETAFGAASGFVEILPGSYNVAVTSGAGSTVVTNVGDGSGSGTVANKTYEAGKIYTVVLRGLSGATIAPDLQPKAVLIQNN